MLHVGGRLSQRAQTIGLLLVIVGVLAVYAAEADRTGGIGWPWAVAQDLAVGLCFVVAAAAASGPDLQRALVASVGAAWLVGSLTPLAVTLHQGVLLLALAAFPSGKPTGMARLLLPAASVLIVVRVLPPWAVALVFLAVALVRWARSGSSPASVYPVVASVCMALALGFVWWDSEGVAPGAGPQVYGGVLAAVAVGYSMASWALTRQRRRLADQVLDDPPDGLDGLVVLLRRAVGDETLTVTATDPDGAGASSGRLISTPRGRTLLVSEDAEVMATVNAISVVLDDEPTAGAVLATVRLFLRNRRLRDEQQQRLAMMSASRARLLAAADRERRRTSSRLSREVTTPLTRASRAMADLDLAAMPEGAGSLSLVRAELAGVANDVRRLVAGSPPVSLGQGRLAAALDDLVARSPGQVRLSHVDRAPADSLAETALFYVCCEAVANAAKHAPGVPVTIDLSASDQLLVLTVRDEGPGGADPAGSGLVGLVDRLATVDGTLEIVSVVGKGTRVVARVPVTVAGRTRVPRAGRGPGELPPLPSPG